MEFRRWKFSKHVKPELKEFLNCVKRKEEDNQSLENLEKQKLLHIFLPKLPFSYYGLEDHDPEPPKNEEVIIIDTDSEDAPIYKQISKYEDIICDNLDISVINLTLANADEDVTDTNIQYYVEYLGECFNNDDVLQNEVIKKISAELDAKSLAKLFKSLNETLLNKHLLNFGQSLCVYSVQTFEVAKQYARFVLLDKLIKSDSSQLFKSLIKDFSEVYTDITIEEIFLPLINNDKCENTYHMLLGTLQDSDKAKIIRDFVFQSSELEAFHLVKLEPLIPLIREDTTKRRLINLLSVSAEQFSSDKLFIKILIELIRNLGKGFIDQEPILFEMIDKNKTLLRTTALKALHEWFNNYSVDN